MIHSNNIIVSNENTKIPLKISFPYKLGKRELPMTITIIFYKNQTLLNGFNYYLLSNNIRLKKSFRFYLKRGNKIKRELSINKKISELDLYENDIVIVSYKSLEIENEKEDYINIIPYEEHNPDTERPISDNNIPKNETSNSDNLKRKKLTKKKIILIILFGALLIISLITIIVLIILRGENHINFDKEKLIIEKEYPSNLLLRFRSKQENIITLEGDEINEDNKTFEISQITDFIFIVRESHIEYDKQQKLEKIWYSGYIGLLNVTLINKTHSMTNIFDKSLNNYLNERKIRELEETNLNYADKQGQLCFAKIEFYKNGDIKNYYIPEGFSIFNFVYIEEIARLIIPKISSNLYVENINQKFKELTTINETKNSNEIGNESYIEDNIEDNYRRNINYKNYSINRTMINSIIEKKRGLSDDSSIFDGYNFSYSEEVFVEDYLKKPLSNSIDYDLREANKYNNTISATNITKNFSNLTEFSVKSIECDEAKMEGGMTNTTIYSVINEDGLLESVVEKTISLMTTGNQDINEEDEEEKDDDEDTDALKREVYNEDNEITLKDIENETKINNNISFGINNLMALSEHIINCTDKFIDKSINKKLYNYFDSFKYSIYKENNEKEVL